jgi:hypothetical protein
MYAKGLCYICGCFVSEVSCNDFLRVCLGEFAVIPCDGRATAFRRGWHDPRPTLNAFIDSRMFQFNTLLMALISWRSVIAQDLYPGLQAGIA